MLVNTVNIYYLIGRTKHKFKIQFVLKYYILKLYLGKIYIALHLKILNIINHRHIISHLTVYSKTVHFLGILNYVLT